MKKIRIGAAALAAILICVGGYTLINRGPQAAAVQNVETAKVEKGSIVVKVTGSGTVKPVEEATVKAPDSGKVAAMSAAKGDQVKQGDVLIEYEPVDKSSEIRQEELTYQKLQIQLEDAQQTLKEQAAAEGVSDTLKNNVKKLQLDLELSQERLNNFLKLAGSPDPVLAPISGELIELVPLKGDQLTPGATVAKVANYKLLEVKIEVDELDVIKLKTGVKADLTFDALPNEVFKGEVNSISNQGVADNGVSVYDVLIRFTPVEGIRSGMSVQASIVTSEKTDALLLSIEAVEEVSGKKRVTLHKEANDSNSRQTVDIRTGLFDETNIEVVDGLKEGDTVILPATQAGKKSSLNPMSGPGGF